MKFIHKALGISLLIHLIVIISLVVLPSILARKVYTPVYQVDLVTPPEPPKREPVVQPQQPQKKMSLPKEPPKPVKKATLPKEPPKPVKKAAPPKKKVEKKQVAKKKEAPPQRSLKDVQRAIDKIREKTALREESEAQHRIASRVIQAKRNAYFDAIAARIQANWSLLKNEMENVGTLTADIGLHIRRDGTITMIMVEKTSGNHLFDEWAVRAVKRSAPLPPFPEELKEGRLEVTIGLSS